MIWVWKSRLLTALPFCSPHAAFFPSPTSAPLWVPVTSVSSRQLHSPASTQPGPIKTPAHTLSWCVFSASVCVWGSPWVPPGLGSCYQPCLNPSNSPSLLSLSESCFCLVSGCLSCGCVEISCLIATVPVSLIQPVAFCQTETLFFATLPLAGHFLCTCPCLLQTTWQSLPAVPLFLLFGL